MSNPEEIETISFTTKPFPLDGDKIIRVTYTIIDGEIHNLASPDIAGPAIINGKPCVRGRIFTEESLKKIEKMLSLDE